MLRIAFPGNKATRYKEVKALIQAGGFARVYEPFGGSAVLGVNLKDEGVVEYANANDFSGFLRGLPARIDAEEKVAACALAAGLKPTDRRPLTDEEKARLHAAVAECTDEELSAGRLFFSFSAARAADAQKTRAQILKEYRYFMRLPDRAKTEAYIRGVAALDLEQLDWRDYLNAHAGAMDDPEACFLIDPPYLNSEQKQYNAQWFGLAETVEIIDRFRRARCGWILFNQRAADMRALFELAAVPGYEVHTRLHLVPGGQGTQGRQDCLIYVPPKRG